MKRKMKKKVKDKDQEKQMAELISELTKKDVNAFMFMFLVFSILTPRDKFNEIINSKEVNNGKRKEEA